MKLVRRRGRFWQEACQETQGGIAAIMVILGNLWLCRRPHGVRRFLEWFDTRDQSFFPPHPDPLPVGEGTAVELVVNNPARLIPRCAASDSPSPRSPIPLTPDPSPIGWERGTAGRGPG